MPATQAIIKWICADIELVLNVQDFLPSNEYDYGITELRDWIEALLYAPGIYAYRPEGLARTAALATVRKAVTEEAFAQIDWDLVLKSVALDSRS
jgi:hypothetical protein